MTASDADAPVMRRRIAIAIGLVVYGLLALGSGLDRLAAGRADLATRVPGLFASEALRSLGSAALATGKAESAARLGRLALLDAPTDPQSPALYGAGMLASGDRVTADRAFRVAGQLGWRVPLTQTYWMGRALADADYRTAALRLDALLRQQPSLLAQRQLLDPMERNPAGRSALIERMKLRPGWLDHYAGDVAAAPADSMQQRFTVLQEAAQAGLVIGCPAIAPGADRLAFLGLIQEGTALWHLHCPAAGTGLLADGQFEMLDLGTRPSAFSWQPIGNNELALGVAPAPGGSGRRLTIDGSPLRTRPVVSQLLALSPGQYRVSWRAGAVQGALSDKIVPALSCRSDAPIWQAPKLEPRSQRWQAEVTVPAGCASQTLNFGVAPGTNSVWLEQVELERLQ